MKDYWVAVLSPLPNLVVSAISFMLNSVIRADRNEPRGYAMIKTQELAKRVLPRVPAAGGRPKDAGSYPALTAEI